MRLDLHVSQKMALSRNKSSELIKKGEVFINGEPVKKPSFKVEEGDIVEVKSLPLHVSRAGEKLAGFLKSYPLAIKDRLCLDVGSSTGGFVEVLLREGAKKVVAVDVGSEQLHVNLRGNDKIELHEKTDIRNFNTKREFDIVTCDVSFIAFKDVVDSIDRLANRDIIILFKPQFEVGREIKRDKKGVIHDKYAINKANEYFKTVALEKGWELITFEESVIRGKEGNLESFYAFKKR